MDDYHTWSYKIPHIHVAFPRKQLNQDFSTNMLLQIDVGIRLILTMAPNIPQCTLKIIVIQLGPPFYFEGVKMVKKGNQLGKKFSGHG